MLDTIQYLDAHSGAIIRESFPRLCFSPSAKPAALPRTTCYCKFSSRRLKYFWKFYRHISDFRVSIGENGRKRAFSYVLRSKT